jgi:hypothetical protein
LQNRSASVVEFHTAMAGSGTPLKVLVLTMV